MENSPRISPMTNFQAQNSQAQEVSKKVEYGPVQTAVLPPDTLESSIPTARDNPQRTRHSSACFPCAKRKVKCDRDIQNPCSNCSKRGQPEGCLVKTPKDRLSQSLSEQSPRDAEGHRDKRTRYDGYQVSFQTGPSTIDSPSPQLLPSHVSSTGSRAQTLLEDQPPPTRQSTSSTNNSRKSREAMQWEAVEPLLPPRKDLLKYIGTYRIGPHIVNPVISNLDAFESHACTFLEEVGTPKIRQRLASKDRRASEIELSRLGRLLAVLASGARYEDSNYTTQVAVSREYVRKAFQCLRLANYMLRPTIECIQTLLLLTVELQNDHQVGAAWALLGTTTRLAHVISIPSRIANLVHHDQDALMASRSIVWQDIMLALVHGDPEAGPTISTDLASMEIYLPDVASYLPMIFRFHTLGIELVRRNSLAQREAREGSETKMRLHEIRELYRDISSRDSKSMKDRYEHAGLKLFAAHMLAQALAHFNDSNGNSNLGGGALDPEREPTEIGHEACVDVIRTFIDFSAISNVPVRTWMMIHCTLEVALDLCDEKQLDLSSSTLSLMARLTQLLGGGAHMDVPLSSGHAAAVQALDQFCGYVEQRRGEEEEENLPYQIRGLVGTAINQLANTDGPSMEPQALWGL